jgi:hypothetical protein
VDDDGDVPCAQESFASLQFSAKAVAAPHRKSVGILVEELAVETLEGVADADHEVEGAGELSGHDRGPAPGHDVKPGRRRHHARDREKFLVADLQGEGVAGPGFTRLFEHAAG